MSKDLPPGAHQHFCRYRTGCIPYQFLSLTGCSYEWALVILHGHTQFLAAYAAQ